MLTSAAAKRCCRPRASCVILSGCNHPADSAAVKAGIRREDILLVAGTRALLNIQARRNSSTARRNSTAHHNSSMARRNSSRTAPRLPGTPACTARRSTAPRQASECQHLAPILRLA